MSDPAVTALAAALEPAAIPLYMPDGTVFHPFAPDLLADAVLAALRANPAAARAVAAALDPEPRAAALVQCGLCNEFIEGAARHSECANRLTEQVAAHGRAAALAEVRARVGKYIAHHNHEAGKNCVSAFCAAGLHAAFLAIIEEVGRE